MTQASERTPVEPLPETRTGASTGAAASRGSWNVGLLHIIRGVIKADSDPARQALFANLLQSRLLVRSAFRLHHHVRGTRGSALVIGCYGLLAFLSVAPPRNRRGRVMAIAQHANARRQVARVGSWVGAADYGVVRTGARAVLGVSAVAGLASLLYRGRALKVLRAARVIEKRHGLMVSLRAIGAIAWYARARAILEEQRPGAIVVSSDSNPEELGFVGAARTLNIPQVFISHAYPTPLSPPLDFDLSILEGDAAVQERRRKGRIRGRVLLAGIEGESVPANPGRFERRRPVIGVFTPKAVAWPTLAAIIDDCRRHYEAREIVIRWHPSMLERPHLDDWVPDLTGIVEASSTVPVAEVAARCDWVIADENSNVHLPVLKLGIPTVAVRNLGLYPAIRSDLYGFVANGIVFPPVTSIRDVDPAALRAFFSEDWARRFAHYDVSYLRPHGAIGREVRDSIWALFDQPTPPKPMK